MAETGKRRLVRTSPHSKKQLVILQALETVARRAGFKVSAGQLRYAGLKLKGGSCLLRGCRWLILDKHQPFDDLLDIFREALSLDDLAAGDLEKGTLALVAPYFQTQATDDSASAEKAA
jgi:hypothetical protein